MLAWFDFGLVSHPICGPTPAAVQSETPMTLASLFVCSDAGGRQPSIRAGADAHLYRGVFVLYSVLQLFVLLCLVLLCLVLLCLVLLSLPARGCFASAALSLPRPRQLAPHIAATEFPERSALSTRGRAANKTESLVSAL